MGRWVLPTTVSYGARTFLSGLPPSDHPLGPRAFHSKEDYESFLKGFALFFFKKSDIFAILSRKFWFRHSMNLR